MRFTLNWRPSLEPDRDNDLKAVGYNAQIITINYTNRLPVFLPIVDGKNLGVQSTLRAAIEAAEVAVNG